MAYTSAHAGGMPASGRSSWLLDRVMEVAIYVCPTRPDGCVLCVAATKGQTAQLQLWLRDRHPDGAAALERGQVRVLSWRMLLRQLLNGAPVVDSLPALLARRSTVPYALTLLRPIALALDNVEQFLPAPEAGAWLACMAEVLQVPLFTTRYGPPPVRPGLAPGDNPLLMMDNRRQGQAVCRLMHVVWWVNQVKQRTRRRAAPSAPPPLAPGAGVTIIPLPAVASELDAEAAARALRPWLTANTTVVAATGYGEVSLVVAQLVAHHGVAQLGRDRPWPAPGAVGAAPLNYVRAVELPGDVVVVCNGSVGTDDLVQCCTRGPGRLMLAVLGPQMPAPLCAPGGASAALLQPIVHGDEYVLWDVVGGKAARAPKRRAVDGGSDAAVALPAAVSAAAAALAEGCTSPEAALAAAALRLGWRAPPAVHAVRAAREPMLEPPPFVQRHGLQTLVGHAAELVVAHAQAWRWDGAGPPAPALAAAVAAALVCDDAAFLAGWNCAGARMRDALAADAAGWRRRLQPARVFGGDGAVLEAMAARLAGRAPPHVLLPPSLMAHVPAVQAALAVYCAPRPAAAVQAAAVRAAPAATAGAMSLERAYYVLGAATLAATAAHSRKDVAGAALRITCDDAAWAEALALPAPGSRSARDALPLFFFELEERAKDALQAMHVSSLAPQVEVVQDGGMRGLADFVATCHQPARPSDIMPGADSAPVTGQAERVVVEIKACSSLAARPAWAVQAAAYAHTLGLRTAYVFNILSGELLALRFGGSALLPSL